MSQGFTLPLTFRLVDFLYQCPFIVFPVTPPPVEDNVIFAYGEQVIADGDVVDTGEWDDCSPDLTVFIANLNAEAIFPVFSSPVSFTPLDAFTTSTVTNPIPAADIGSFQITGACPGGPYDFSVTVNISWTGGAGGSRSFTLIGSVAEPPPETILTDFLLVGGGGPGGYGLQDNGNGGGGSGGEVKEVFDHLLDTSTSYPVQVGASGTGSATSPVNGGDTSIDGETAIGGGAGVGVAAGTAGAYGGGGKAGLFGPTAGVAGLVAFNGGTGQAGSPYASGGGGGASAPGLGGASGGTGGNGVSSSMSGTPTTYGGGGGGGADDTVRVGGTGGGGDGGRGDPLLGTIAPTEGTDGLGGGGGGGASQGSSVPGRRGGTGVAIVRYLGEPLFSGGNVVEDGGYTIHTFTTDGTLVPIP